MTAPEAAKLAEFSELEACGLASVDLATVHTLHLDLGRPLRRRDGIEVRIAGIRIKSSENRQMSKSRSSSFQQLVFLSAWCALQKEMIGAKVEFEFESRYGIYNHHWETWGDPKK